MRGVGFPREENCYSLKSKRVNTGLASRCRFQALSFHSLLHYREFDFHLSLLAQVQLLVLARGRAPLH